MTQHKQFLYFPSFSSKASLLKKDDMSFGTPGTPSFVPTIRFYDDRYPERWRHKYFLLTAAMFHKRKTSIREDLGMQDTCIFGDSGGFQVANGSLKWDKSLLESIFRFLEAESNIAMNLDIPPKIDYTGKFRECLEISVENFKYFADHQSGKTKFLNVLQMDGQTDDFHIWYDAVKDFEFNGWGVGGTLLQHYNSLYVTALLLSEREFEKKSCEYLHFLGATNPFNFLIYACIQKNFVKYYPHCTLTTDSSTPLYQTTYGNWAHTINYNAWNYHWIWMPPKKRANLYVEGARLPCMLDNCPVCSNITYSDLKHYDTSDQFAVRIGWHSLAVFQKSLEIITNIAHLLGDVEGMDSTLMGFADNDIIMMMKSIDEMFEKPEDAMKVFHKYSKLYMKISNKFGKKVDPNLVNSDELFA